MRKDKLIPLSVMTSLIVVCFFLWSLNIANSLFPPPDCKVNQRLTVFHKSANHCMLPIINHSRFNVNKQTTCAINVSSLICLAENCKDVGLVGIEDIIDIKTQSVCKASPARRFLSMCWHQKGRKRQMRAITQVTLLLDTSLN